MRQASTLCDATKRGHDAQCPLAEFLLHPADPRPCAASMVGILLAFDALRVCNRLRYLPAAGDCRAGRRAFTAADPARSARRIACVHLHRHPFPDAARSAEELPAISDRRCFTHTPVEPAYIFSYNART